MRSSSVVNDYSKAVGDRLRTVRKRTGMSLDGVEEKSGGAFKSVVVGSYERGDRNLTVGRLHELATLYGVQVADLLPDGPSDMSAAADLVAAVAALGWTPPPNVARDLREESCES